MIGDENEFIGTPSTTHNGSEKRRPCSTSSELYPRMVTAVPPPPGAPDICVTSIPATRPCNNAATLAAGIPRNSSAFTTEMAPVLFLRVVLPYATTIVSSNDCTSSSITTRNESFAIFSENSTTFFLNPTKENSNAPFCIGKSIANHPFSLVAVPTATPTTFTVTPGRGCFCVSYTKPFTLKDFLLESTSPFLGTIKIISPCVIAAKRVPCNTVSTALTT